MIKNIKLHIGCGTLYKDGWINIDNNSDNNIEKLDINHDLSTGLPFDDLSVDYIYNEHFIEHLSREDGLKFMYECHRVLKIGGILRISCPDLDKIIEGYINNNWREQNWVKTYHYEWVESKCQMLNLNLNETPWGHKYVYNKEELLAQLIKAGFNKENIQEEVFLHSQSKDLCNIDTRVDGMFIEAKKTNHLIKTEQQNPINYTSFIQLFFDLGNGITEENSIKLSVSKNLDKKKFIFNLKDKPNIKALRLDPLNECCVIEIESLHVKKNTEAIDLLPYVQSNAEIHHGKSYFFTTDDSQIYLSGLDESTFENTQELVVVLRYVHIAKDALHVSVKQITQELENKEEAISKITQELSLIHLSKSWRFTKPLRNIRNFLKSNRS